MNEVLKFDDFLNEDERVDIIRPPDNIFFVTAGFILCENYFNNNCTFN